VFQPSDTQYQIIYDQDRFFDGQFDNLQDDDTNEQNQVVSSMYTGPAV